MSTTPYSPVFYDSCKQFNKGDCQPNQRLIDPCFCQRYFLCVNKEIISQTCSQGTAYDHTASSTSSAFCRKEQDIFLENICRTDKPWLRCKSAENVTDSALNAIESRCTGTVATPAGTGSQSSSDTGAIVGGVIGGLILILIVIACVVLYKRGYSPSLSFKKKKKLTKNQFDNRGSVNNPQYFGNEPHIIDEHYASIEDTARHYEHVNGAPRLPERPPTLQSSSNSGDRKQSVTSVQTYMEPSPSVLYGFNNNAFNISDEKTDTLSSADNAYIEILPDVQQTNGHVTLNRHNGSDEVSPYDNSSFPV